MNKRSLLFLFILSFSMLAVNLFFKPSKKIDTKATTAIEQTVAKKPSLETRVATQAELPLVDIYKDAEGKNLLATGLLYNNQILTLAWDTDLPQEVFYKKSHSSFPIEQAKILSSTAEVSDPILLQTASSTSDAMDVAELSKSGSYEVQLVQPKAYNSKTKISAASYHNGQVHLASDDLKGNALALSKTSTGEYQPVGIYVQSENRVVPIKTFANLKSHVSVHKLSEPVRHSEEKFYVLENEYQQLVFSNYGGALAEINLPLNDSEHEKSRVYAVEFDEKLKNSASSHALFPSHSYYQANGSKESQPKKGGYYPLIRRSADLDSARYYAFNLVSEYPEVSELVYKVTHFDEHKIVFESKQSHRTITKTFTLDDSPYGMNVSIKVDGDNSGLWLTSGVPEIELISNMQSPTLKYRHQNQNKFEVAKQKLPKAVTENNAVTPDWISNSNGFFTLLINPQEPMAPGYKVHKVKSDTLPSRMQHLESANKKVRQSDGYEFLLPLKESSNEVNLKVFAGPLEKNLLIKADQKNSKMSNYLGAQSYSGFLTFISEPCAKFLLIFLDMFHKITSSWGLSIILLTILLRLILYPLNSWSIKAMRKNQEIAPEVSAIQAKYKKNPKQAQVEIMALYRKRKVNPFTGCLPMLIQMPFLFGMFSLLRSAFVLRGVPFIKGWINNLTAPDVLFSWSQSIPFFGTEFHLLPILSCIMIWIQQKVSSPLPKDKSMLTDQQKQQKMMSYMMLVFMTLLCYNLPSGLNLYFISSTFLGIIQQWLTNRVLDKQKNAPVVLNKKKSNLKKTEA